MYTLGGLILLGISALVEAARNYKPSSGEINAMLKQTKVCVYDLQHHKAKSQHIETEEERKARLEAEDENDWSKV